MKTSEQLAAARKKAASLMGKGSAQKRREQGTLESHMATVRAGKKKLRS